VFPKGGLALCSWSHATHTCSLCYDGAHADTAIVEKRCCGLLVLDPPIAAFWRSCNTAVFNFAFALLCAYLRWQWYLWHFLFRLDYQRMNLNNSILFVHLPYASTVLMSWRWWWPVAEYHFALVSFSDYFSQFSVLRFCHLIIIVQLVIRVNITCYFWRTCSTAFASLSS